MPTPENGSPVFCFERSRETLGKSTDFFQVSLNPLPVNDREIEQSMGIRNPLLL
jgi:hypothetical protein